MCEMWESTTIIYIDKLDMAASENGKKTEMRKSIWAVTSKPSSE